MCVLLSNMNLGSPVHSLFSCTFKTTSLVQPFAGGLLKTGRIWTPGIHSLPCATKLQLRLWNIQYRELDKRLGPCGMQLRR